MIVRVTIFDKISQIQKTFRVLLENEMNMIENNLKLKGDISVIALVIGKNQNIRKSTLLHSLS